MKCFLFKNAKNAKEFAAKVGNIVAVETEYGAESLEMGDVGVVYEMNHHGQKQHLRAPCMRFEIHNSFVNPTFIISHLDLDTIMGIAIATGKIKNNRKNREFGKIAQFVDVKGLHRLKDKNNQFKNYIDCFQYYIEEQNRVFENGEDLTDLVNHLIEQLNTILECGPNLCATTEFNRKKEKLRNEMECKELSNDRIRTFVTNGESLIFEFDERPIILQLNLRLNAITLSVYNEKIAKEYFGDTGVIKPLKDFFGEEAGGKITLGGGIRNKSYSFEDLKDFYEYINNLYVLGLQLFIENKEKK